MKIKLKHLLESWLTGMSGYYIYLGGNYSYRNGLPIYIAEKRRHSIEDFFTEKFQNILAYYYCYFCSPYKENDFKRIDDLVDFLIYKYFHDDFFIEKYFKDLIVI